MAAIDFFNRDLVVHTWSYKLEGRIICSNFNITDLGS
jgi:hypothetical protein